MARRLNEAPPPVQARELFAGIADRYERMGALLSFGQDGRWRRFLVSRIPAGGRVLDVATGTGLVARELRGRGDRVVGLDQSEAMLRAGAAAWPRVLGRAERLPFADGAFDALTVTYLLRYVEDPAAVVAELVRVVRPGGVVASLEFGVPSGVAARIGWRAYTRVGLPVLGLAGSRAWVETGRFLGPSIEGFWRRHPLAEQLGWWRDAGVLVRHRAMSFGTGVVMWGRTA